MEQPEGIVEPGNEGKVMLLLKCLYGLKQSPRQWNIYIDKILRDMGFIRLKSDFGIYMMGEGKGVVFIALYVDDLFLVGKLLERIKDAKRGLSAEFKMKDLGEALKWASWHRNSEALKWECVASRGAVCKRCAD